MFGNGRARSGIIVLPCGAGKTLVGITAIATMKKSALIFCSTGIAVYQWRQQIKQWANIDSSHIVILTSHDKQMPKAPCIVITSYSMMSFQGHRAEQTMPVLNFIKTNPWGLVILDEVQIAPANQFRRCINETNSFCKLGLTATLVREDNKIDDLYYLIGPKLYEANWLDLQDAGYLAKVKCAEIWCPMAPVFYDQYLSESEQNQRRLLCVMNPNKFRVCQSLIAYHEKRGDKVLVFCDMLWPIEYYATKLERAYLHGGTGDEERRKVLFQFQKSNNINCIFISKIGDNSIDLPDVNVIIQISGHYSSRRQEAQRLGRILRPKARVGDQFNAFFYTLISQDTKEVFHAAKRQRFLIDQGYSFKVIPDFNKYLVKDKSLFFGTSEEHKELLHELKEQDDAGVIETLNEHGVDEKARSRRPFQKRAVSMSALSNQQGVLYGKAKRSNLPEMKKRRKELAQEQRIKRQKQKDEKRRWKRKTK